MNYEIKSITEALEEGSSKTAKSQQTGSQAQQIIINFQRDLAPVNMKKKLPNTKSLVLPNTKIDKKTPVESSQNNFQ